MSRAEPIKDLSWVKYSPQLGLKPPASSVRSWTELLRYRRLQWAGHETEQNKVSYRPDDVLIPPSSRRRKRKQTKAEWIELTKLADYTEQDFHWIDTIAQGLVLDSSLREAELHCLRAWRQAHHALCLALSRVSHSDLVGLSLNKKPASAIMSEIQHSERLMQKAAKTWKLTQKVKAQISSL